MQLRYRHLLRCCQSFFPKQDFDSGTSDAERQGLERIHSRTGDDTIESQLVFRDVELGVLITGPRVRNKSKGLGFWEAQVVAHS